MSDIKVLFYKENSTPRSISLSSRTIYRTLFAAMFGGFLVVASIATAARFYVLSRAKLAQQLVPTTPNTEEGVGPSNSTEEQNRSLRDEVERLNAKLVNAARLSAAPGEIDKKNPALALFGPIVTDKTQKQDQVMITNFKYSDATAKTPATLTFELHNAHEGASTEKGYIVVLGRNDKELLAYPNVFNKAGPYLLDFEKGETFQIARFRLVNATFQGHPEDLQILIFTRSGELLINTHYEVNPNAS